MNDISKQTEDPQQTLIGGMWYTDTIDNIPYQITYDFSTQQYAFKNSLYKISLMGANLNTTIG